LDAAVRDWENLPEDQQTVENTITHFTKANALRVAARKHLKEVLEANTVTPVKPGQESPNGQALAALPPPPPPDKWNLKSELWGYCWTHGITKHTSAQCIFPKENHVKTATMWDRQGGCEKWPKYDPNSPKPPGKGNKKRKRDRRDQDTDPER
jgi:hypothetical protein